jgi:hypothetical protein
MPKEIALQSFYTEAGLRSEFDDIKIISTFSGIKKPK